MYIARILYPVEVLGPGKRIGIWFDGCGHRCPGCSNPELWEPQERYAVTLPSVMNLIHLITDRHPVDGFTLTGGDPFYQPEALRELLKELTPISHDILVYTGYLAEELKERYPDLLEQIAVLIDGQYVESRNRGQPLIGSDNQRILFLKEQYREAYSATLSGGQGKIQNFTTRDGVISVGIHRRDYKQRLREGTLKKGLESKRE